MISTKHSFQLKIPLMTLLEIFQCCFDRSGSVLSLKQVGQNTSGKVRTPHFEFLEPVSYNYRI